MAEIKDSPFDGRRGGIGLLLPDRAPPIEP